MISEISRYITGYVRAEVKGEERKRFFNAAIKSGINFWDYSVKKDSVVLSMRIRDYKELIKIRNKFDVSIKIVKKAGLPLILNPYRKRIGLIIGVITGLIISYLLSGRVWVLTAEGSAIYSQEVILEKAKEIGIFEGAKRSDIDPHADMVKLMLSLEGTDWISINTDGVAVDIVVKDSEPKPEILEGESDAPQNVIAKKGGVIRSIEAQDGMISVKVGEGVKEGDILITGLWDTYDRWGVKTGKSFSAAARGKVMAEVIESYCYKINLKDEVYVDGDVSEKRSLYFFGVNIPLSFPSITDGEYVKTIKETPLYILDTKMPIRIISESYTKRIKIPRELTRREGEEMLLDKLYLDEKEKINNGSELLKEDTSFTLSGNTLILNAECRFLEDIAEIKPILFENNLKDE